MTYTKPVPPGEACRGGSYAFEFPTETAKSIPSKTGRECSTPRQAAKFEQASKLEQAAKLEEAGQRASGNAYLEGRQSEAAMVQSAGNEKRQR